LVSIGDHIVVTTWHWARESGRGYFRFSACSLIASLHACTLSQPARLRNSSYLKVLSAWLWATWRHFSGSLRYACHRLFELACQCSSISSVSLSTGGHIVSCTCPLPCPRSRPHCTTFWPRALAQLSRSVVHNVLGANGRDVVSQQSGVQVAHATPGISRVVRRIRRPQPLGEGRYLGFTADICAPVKDRIYDPVEPCKALFRRARRRLQRWRLPRRRAPCQQGIVQLPGICVADLSQVGHDALHISDPVVWRRGIRYGITDHIHGVVIRGASLGLLLHRPYDNGQPLLRRIPGAKMRVGRYANGALRGQDDLPRIVQAHLLGKHLRMLRVGPRVLLRPHYFALAPVCQQHARALLPRECCPQGVLSRGDGRLWYRLRLWCRGRHGRRLRLCRCSYLWGRGGLCRRGGRAVNKGHALGGYCLCPFAAYGIAVGKIAQRAQRRRLFNRQDVRPFEGIWRPLVCWRVEYLTQCVGVLFGIGPHAGHEFRKALHVGIVGQHLGGNVLSGHNSRPHLRGVDCGTPATGQIVGQGTLPYLPRCGAAALLRSSASQQVADARNVLLILSLVRRLFVPGAIETVPAESPLLQCGKDHAGGFLGKLHLDNGMVVVLDQGVRYSLRRHGDLLWRGSLFWRWPLRRPLAVTLSRCRFGILCSPGIPEFSQGARLLAVTPCLAQAVCLVLCLAGTLGCGTHTPGRALSAGNALPHIVRFRILPIDEDVGHYGFGGSLCLQRHAQWRHGGARVQTHLVTVHGRRYVPSEWRRKAHRRNL